MEDGTVIEHALGHHAIAQIEGVIPAVTRDLVGEGRAIEVSGLAHRGPSERGRASSAR